MTTEYSDPATLTVTEPPPCPAGDGADITQLPITAAAPSFELPTEPSIEWDNYGDKLIRTLGSFWYYYFGDRDKLKLHYRSLGHKQEQAYLDYLAAVATVSRFNTPVFKQERWYLLTLSRSDRDSIYNVYGQTGLVYGGTDTYGGAQTAEVFYSLPDDAFFGRLDEIRYVMYNRVLYPSKSWVRGVDFDIDYDRRLIKFRDDPLNSEYVARHEVYDEDGNLVDIELGLWVYNGEFDLDLVYKHWGFAVTEYAKSSQGYKDVVNALWDNYVLGANSAAFTALLSAAVGVPVVIEPVETIVDIVDETTRKLVLTDKHVYAFEPGAAIIVSVDDVVYAGEQLCDALRIIDLSSNTADYSDIQALSFDSSFLSGGYYAALTFENTDVAVEYLGVDNDNKAVVTFRINGFPADIETFFDEAQASGKLAGNKTLAQLLDTRSNPVSEPLPQFLPATINPLQFVLDRIMRNHLILIKIRTSAIPADAPGMRFLRHIRDIIQPHTTAIVFVELSAQADTIDLSQTGDSETPGIDEELGQFGAGTPDDEVLVPVDDPAPAGARYDDVVVRVYRVREQCM